ncbi:MAG: saccharopine dehydrogenase C-terminal domain-containing protein [Cyclobacteriaceae bacterium]
MKQILILGAGRSSSSLIKAMIADAQKNDWTVVVGDRNLDLAKSKVDGEPAAKAISFDILDEENSRKIISQADLVISMVPAAFHIHVATMCAEFGKSMLTASYLSKEIEALAPKFEDKDALCVMEMGLDPGIDHMSAMKVLDGIKEQGHELTSFETFTGGLIAPTQEDNPWKYKFTWNPRNVVLAGQGNVKFIQEGKYKYIPYHKLFTRTEVIHIPGHGYFEGYANRDSLIYLDSYRLKGIKTLYRGTLRRPGYCKAWNTFVQLGATDDTYRMEGVDKMTHRQFINSFLHYNPHDSVELKIAHYLNIGMESEIMYALKWLDIFEEIPVGLSEGTPAQILEHILKKKWTIEEDDKDMIVMWHKFDFLDNGKHRQIQSHMVVFGENTIDTGMSKTVGLPLAITAKLCLQGKIGLRGVHIPTNKALYEPVLEELEQMGFEFQEREVEL